MGAQAAVDQRHQLREVRGRREGAHVEALQRQGDAERVSDCVWSCAPGAVSSFGYKMAGMFSGSNRWSQTRRRGNFAVPMHALVDVGGPCGFANDGEVEAQPHLQLEQPLSRRGGRPTHPSKQRCSPPNPSQPTVNVLSPVPFTRSAPLGPTLWISWLVTMDIINADRFSLPGLMLTNHTGDPPNNLTHQAFVRLGTPSLVAHFSVAHE